MDLLTLVSGIGIGFLFASTGFAIQTANMDRSGASAEVIFTLVRTLRDCLGGAIVGVLFQSRLRIELPSIPNLADNAVTYSREASTSVELIQAMADGAKEKTRLAMAYAKSSKVV